MQDATVAQNIHCRAVADPEIFEGGGNYMYFFEGGANAKSRGARPNRGGPGGPNGQTMQI